jgi:pimeloyl-ACP methyl ester carboxylesterase
MHYKICGQGPLLIYIPGLDGTGELFYRQSAELAQHFTVLTYQLRTAGCFTYSDLIDDIADLITKLNFSAATLCGESFGGTLALQFALTYLHQVERLVIINSFPYFRNRALLIAGRTLLEFMPHELLNWSRWIAVHLRLIAEDLPPESRKQFMEITARIPKLTIMRRLELIAEHDVRAQLSLINRPTLFIASTNDRLQNSLREAEQMAACMPNAKVSPLPGMGHVVLPLPNCSLQRLFAQADFLPS